MNNSFARGPRLKTGHVPQIFPIIVVAASLAAIFSTYVLASSSADVEVKTCGFSAIIAIFLAVCALIYLRRARQRAAGVDAVPSESSEEKIDRRLDTLDEANEFFTGALKSADTFRLVASRVHDVTPFLSATLLLLDENRSHLVVAEAVGHDGQKGQVVGAEDGIASKSFFRQTVEFGDESHSPGERVVPTVAIPLIRGMEVFGVLQLYFDAAYELDRTGASLFEGIGNRVAPLILSSIAFERSQENALTDVTTDLPNERAFHLILENRLAEAARDRDEHALTILTIDVKGFDEVNRKYGHAAGDKVLSFVGHVVKDNLRQMDFFARSTSDEFLAILPTASKEMSHEIIARIQMDLFGRKLKLSDLESIDVDLNFGWATFGEDGETADQLLAIARLRNEQSKSGAPSNVLWFERELVN